MGQHLTQAINIKSLDEPVLLLSIHPAVQFTAILLAYYAAYLGLQRTQSLHFGKTAKFQREQHVIAGPIALVAMLGGLAAGHIIVARFIQNSDMGLHKNIATALLPFLLFGLLSGFYLYFKPEKRKIIPAIHALNDLLILLLLMQIFTRFSAPVKLSKD